MSQIPDSQLDLNELGERSEFDFSVVPLHNAQHPDMRTQFGTGAGVSPGAECYGIILITQGGGKCILDADSYELRPNTVIFLRPNQRIVLESDGGICGFEILFSEGFLTLNEVRAHQLPGAGLFTDEVRRQVHMFGQEEAEKALRVIQDIKAEYDLRHPAYVTALRSFLIVLLLQFWRNLRRDPSLSGPGTTMRNDVVSRYHRLVATDPRLDRTVAYYAKTLDVSASHLHELVKEATGNTPISVIQREVILEAKRLLIHTTRQVADIADALSFKDASYFGRYFRRNTGKTPGEFRRHSRKSLGLEAPD